MVVLDGRLDVGSRVVGPGRTSTYPGAAGRILAGEEGAQSMLRARGVDEATRWRSRWTGSLWAWCASR